VSDRACRERPRCRRASKYREALPTIYALREFAEAGGLMSYGSNFAELYRQAGAYTSRVLKGEVPFASGEPGWSNPITGIAACCARATNGHAIAPPRSATKSRRPVPDMGGPLPREFLHSQPTTDRRSLGQT
jgi:hypothetical protein